MVDNTAFTKLLVVAATEQTKKTIIYNDSYVSIPYPYGDVPAGQGVCTDVIVRAYRQCGIDLQHLVHKDMSLYLHQYPKTYGLNEPDSNIDHRRVLNLMVFFKHHGKELPITKNPMDYQPGDLVTWNTAPLFSLKANVPHIGLITDQLSQSGERLLIVHHRGALKFGPKIEDRLFAHPITGHYRYDPKEPKDTFSLVRM